MSGRILVVDDRESTRYVLATWLRRAGFDVTEAATGGEALARVDAHTDVVVLDVNLPDMSGFEVCSAIKASANTAQVAVMHVSATAVDVHSRAEGLERGADAYLTEPVDPTEFLATVRALRRMREARRAVASAVDRLTRLAAVTLPLNTADSIPRLLEAAAQGAADVFGEPAIAVAELDPGRAARALCAGRGASTVVEAVGAPLSPMWADGPLDVPPAEVPDAWRALIEQEPGASGRRWWAVPVREADAAMTAGIAVALAGDAGGLTPDEQEMLHRLAESTGVALRNLRAFAEEQRIALTLQQALLPDVLPAPAGLEFAARYSASSEGVSVGGDFYDVFALPSGHVVVLIGDVQGHSLLAATIMAEVRFSARAYLLEGHTPVEVLDLLNTLLLREHPEATATLVVLVIDPDRSTLEIANAGHIPPLFARDHEAWFVEDTGVLLGVPWSSHESVTVPLPPGADVILTTDGLLERRGGDLRVALERFRDVVVAARTHDPEQLADCLLRDFSVGDAEDDVAVVVVRRTSG